MRIGIVSDTHGDAPAWRDLVGGIFRGVDLVLHAGDILYQGSRPRHDPAVMAGLINDNPAPVLFARGNCDTEEDQLLLDYPVMSPYVFLQADGLRILVTHGQALDRAGLGTKAARYRVHLMVYGHTHKPLLAEEGGAVLLNPGSPALPKGAFPSAAVLDGDVLRLYDLSTGGVAGEMRLKVKDGR
ncbi:MAG: phosphodiesterase [Peptococcaceae bacterium]|nr:phosphodiesterase [Peptococcaceae bacterium]